MDELNEKENGDVSGANAIYLWLLSLCVGLAAGVGIGTAIGRMGAGVAIGTGAGVAFGLFLVRRVRPGSKGR